MPARRAAGALALFATLALVAATVAASASASAASSVRSSGLGLAAIDGNATSTAAALRGPVRPPSTTTTFARGAIGTIAPHMDRYIVATEADFLGTQVATYYGPGFWGNRTACGSTLERDTWGIAHRTLPCGTIVTIAHRGKRVAVPVIDRGPFSGASVDLTEQTADYLGFTSRGRGDVAMSVVERYRLRIERVPKA